MPSSQKKRKFQQKTQNRKNIDSNSQTFLSSQDGSEELQILDAKLKSLRLVRHQIPKDGACLFRAVAEYIYGTQALHSKVRNEVVDYLSQHKEQFSPFVECQDGKSYETYLEFMRKDKAWGGQIELQAISLRYSVDVIIYSQRENEIPPILNGSKKTLKLCFSHGNHYDLVYTQEEFDILSFCQGLVLDLIESVFDSNKNENPSLVSSSININDHTYQNFGYQIWINEVTEFQREDERIAKQLQETLASSGEFVEVRSKRKKKKNRNPSQSGRYLAHSEETLTSSSRSHLTDAQTKILEQHNKSIPSKQQPNTTTTVQNINQTISSKNNNNNNKTSLKNVWSQKKNWEEHFIGTSPNSISNTNVSNSNREVSSLEASTISGLMNPDQKQSNDKIKESNQKDVAEGKSQTHPQSEPTKHIENVSMSSLSSTFETQSLTTSQNKTNNNQTNSQSNTNTVQQSKVECTSSQSTTPIETSQSTPTTHSVSSPTASNTSTTSNVQNLSKSKKPLVILPQLSATISSSNFNITFGSNQKATSNVVTLNEKPSESQHSNSSSSSMTSTTERKISASFQTPTEHPPSTSPIFQPPGPSAPIHSFSLAPLKYPMSSTASLPITFPPYPPESFTQYFYPTSIDFSQHPPPPPFFSPPVFTSQYRYFFIHSPSVLSNTHSLPHHSQYPNTTSNNTSIKAQDQVTKTSGTTPTLPSTSNPLQQINDSSHNIATQDNSQRVISDSYHKSSTLNQK